jgi:adenine-specific DNA-methyltransferase
MSSLADHLSSLNDLSAPQLRRLLTEHLTKQKLGLYWESSTIERDAALNANIVLPRLVEDDSHGLNEVSGPGTPNLIIEGVVSNQRCAALQDCRRQRQPGRGGGL